MNYKLFSNTIEITDYITSIKSYTEFESGNIIGNAPSTKFVISLDNTTQSLNNMLDNTFYFYKEDELLYTLKVYDKPESVFTNLELTLYDNLVKANIQYNTNIEMYPCCIEDQLREMSELMKVPIEYSSLPQEILKREISSYDNTETIRQYLCWIAERSSSNVMCRANGTIYFKPVSKKKSHNIENDDYVYSFEKGNKYECSMVVCELLNLYEGNELGNIIKISENNPYITSQEDITDIFNKIGGITFDSIKDLKMRNIGTSSVGEIVHYKDYFDVFFMKTEIAYYSGDMSHDVVTVSGEIPSSLKSSYVGDNNYSAKIRRLKIEVDENNQTLQVVSKEQNELKEDVGELNIGFNEISTTVKSTQESIYKFETGNGNIFENCNQYIYKENYEHGEIISSNMPLGIDKNYIRNKDIAISVDVDVVNANVTDLGNYVGAEFTVRYADNTKKIYSTRWYLGQYNLQYLLQTSANDYKKRIWATFKLEDKEILSISNLNIVISLDAKKVIVSNPKVEIGIVPTGFTFDMNYIRDNMVTLQKDYTLIKQEVKEISLQAVSMEEQITTIKGDTTSLITRMNSVEIKLQPTNIMLAVNEQLGAGGSINSVKFILDMNGGHFKGGGLDISNNAGTKVLYADISGNLVINNLTATNGNFSGVITSNSGTIGGWNVNSDGLKNETISIDKNGVTNIYTWADLAVIQLIIMGQISLSGDGVIEHYDFNGDGKVTSSDYIILRNKLLAL